MKTYFTLAFLLTASFSFATHPSTTPLDRAIELSYTKPEEMKSLLSSPTIIIPLRMVSKPTWFSPGGRDEKTGKALAGSGVLHCWKVEVLEGNVANKDNFPFYENSKDFPDWDVVIEKDSVVFLTEGNKKSWLPTFKGETIRSIFPAAFIQDEPLKISRVVVADMCGSKNVSDLELMNYVVGGKGVGAIVALNELLLRERIIRPDLALACVAGKNETIRDVILVRLLADNNMSAEDWKIFRVKLKEKCGVDLGEIFKKNMKDVRFRDGDSYKRYDLIKRAFLD